MRGAAIALMAGLALSTGNAWGQGAPAQSKEGNWLISQTTSPVDYSEIATATTFSRDGADETALKLSIRCRGRRVELLITGPNISGPGGAYSMSYRVNSGPLVQTVAVPPTSGAGVAVGGDVVRLLQSLPDGGSVAVHLVPRAGPAVDGVFSLVGLEAVRTRMAAACEWPRATARPNE
jgi:hypothetical protein